MTIHMNAYGSGNASIASQTTKSSSVTTTTPSFTQEMYSDPEMRPYLRAYYEKAYAPIRERIAAMREEGYEPVTFEGSNEAAATEISADQYEAMIPDFDSWLDSQKTIVPKLRSSQEQMLEHARERVRRAEQTSPDDQSDVRAIFSVRDQILGYMDKYGGMASHNIGGYLRTFDIQANELGLTGQARIDYVTDAISRRYPDVEITTYSNQNAPTERQFKQRWYPHHDVDQAYQTELNEAREALARAEEIYRKQQSNIREMQSFLLGLMEQGA
ncbi:MAG: hypothetical protein JJ871_12395 [Thalassospira sp.]|uniref:hypothetical protein n=1 Tax=Thalassospira sp. TaxID=1912094 RepID=UPI001B083EB4|nr:hypothetical protein [Thalassospira sp.]MBO6577864.1 hypothetical protein [Thalassospira sp.]MBO6816907.1 hypothetical protein [Thalassospira sp.]MBO6888855.1 hypothetical protein [Thalassospira sp.]